MFAKTNAQVAPTETPALQQPAKGKIFSQQQQKPRLHLVTEDDHARHEEAMRSDF